MKSGRDSVTLSIPAPSFCIYAISFQQTIHQIIYRFDSELSLRFKLVNNDNGDIPFQIYRAEGEICNEKVFLFENKQGKTNIIPAYKSSKFIVIVTHNGYLDRKTYTDLFNSMSDSPQVYSLPEQELSAMRTSSLNILLSNLD